MRLHAESLHRLINEIQRQHSPELRSFAVNKVNFTGYTDEHNMLQAMITLKKRQGVEIGHTVFRGHSKKFIDTHTNYLHGAPKIQQPSESPSKHCTRLYGCKTWACQKKHSPLRGPLVTSDMSLPKIEQRALCIRISRHTTTFKPHVWLSKHCIVQFK